VSPQVAAGDCRPQVDALDPEAAERHAAKVVRTARRLDASINAVSIRGDLRDDFRLEIHGCFILR
jgi:hypothetical protein